MANITRFQVRDRLLQNVISFDIFKGFFLQHCVLDVFDVWLFALTRVYNTKLIRTSKRIKICSNCLT